MNELLVSVIIVSLIIGIGIYALKNTKIISYEPIGLWLPITVLVIIFCSALVLTILPMADDWLSNRLIKQN